MENWKFITKLNPNWITGFVDGEGCFMINIVFRKDCNKWEVRPCFQIRLHRRDFELLSSIKSFFQETGNIYIYQSDLIYKVQNKGDLTNIIVPHFEKYLLLTEKQNDFTLFKKILDILDCSLLDSEDIKKIIELKGSLNRGLSLVLKEQFPDVSYIKRPESKSINKLDPNWLAGFFSAEGCFFIKLEKKQGLNTNYNNIRLRIEIGQHSRDVALIYYLPVFLKCGYTIIWKNKDYISYSVSKFEDISSKIIPFFEKYPILGVKSQDFKDFCLVSELMKKKIHLTKDGMEKILNIKSGMNKGRYKN
jgi:hypothetical protein